MAIQSTARPQPRPMARRASRRRSRVRNHQAFSARHRGTTRPTSWMTITTIPRSLATTAIHPAGRFRRREHRAAKTNVSSNARLENDSEDKKLGGTDFLGHDFEPDADYLGDGKWANSDLGTHDPFAPVPRNPVSWNSPTADEPRDFDALRTLSGAEPEAAISKYAGRLTGENSMVRTLHGSLAAAVDDGRRQVVTCDLKSAGVASSCQTW